VYDYKLGKADWLAHRGPIEGTKAADPTVGDFARDDVVTCVLDDPVGEVGRRIAESPYPFGLVTSSGGVLLGRLRSSMLDCDPRLRADEVMEPGPKTFRPSKPAGVIAVELGTRGFRWAIVTTPEGVLIGVATRAELEATSSEQS
jgi:CBS domain-containing protein